MMMMRGAFVEEEEEEEEEEYTSMYTVQLTYNHFQRQKL